jgi:hypothetical protein
MYIRRDVLPYLAARGRNNPRSAYLSRSLTLAHSRGVLAWLAIGAVICAISLNSFLQENGYRAAWRVGVSASSLIDQDFAALPQSFTNFVPKAADTKAAPCSNVIGSFLDPSCPWAHKRVQHP